MNSVSVSPVRGAVLRNAFAFTAAAALLAARAAATDFSANIALEWTDRTGTVHPLGYAATVWTYSTSFSTYTGGGFAAANGSVTATGSAVFDSSTTFNGQFQTIFGSGGTEWFRIVNNNGDLFAAPWGPVTATGTTPGALTTGVDNTDDGGRAFGIGQFLAFGRQYAQGLGVDVQQFTVRYGEGLTEDYYNQAANGQLARITFSQNLSWCSSDVILHELGHHIAQSASIANLAPGGPHSWSGDNISGRGRPGDTAAGIPVEQALGAQNGSRMAFSEAFATYFALTAVRSGNLAAAIPGLSSSASNNGVTGRDTDATFGYYQNAGSRAYDASVSELFRYSLETPISRDPTSDQASSFYTLDRLGEGCELSVGMVLWDLYDGENEAFTHLSYNRFGNQPDLGGRDRVTYGDRAMWDRIVHRNSPQNFHDVWRNITDDCATPAGRAAIANLATASHYEAVSAIGQILEAAAIAFVPRGATNAADPSQTVYSYRPEFSLFEQNGGNSPWFRVLIFSQDWSQLINIGDAIAVGQDETARLYTVTTDLAPGTYWWVVANAPAGTTSSDLTAATMMSWYWSGSLPVTVVPTPGCSAVFAACAVAAKRRRRRV